MNERRTMELTVDKLYQIIGSQNVEILVLRTRIAELEAQIKALTPAAGSSASPAA
jgi:hypothetical protein